MIGGANEKQSCFNPYASFDLLYFAKKNSNNDFYCDACGKEARAKIISIAIILAYFCLNNYCGFSIASFLLF